jgi:tripartite-type tricarboxylate transporter receptor subunit TctC
MKRLILTLSVLCCLGIVTAAQAQDKYPSKPVKILVPYAPGGATDIITRLLADQLRQILGQPFVVENKPGAFGILAIEEMARSRPDGHTLMVGNVSTNAITPVLFAKKMSINYERDVVAVARLADLPSFFIATSKNFPPKSLQEVVDYAKRNPDKVRYTSAGVGSFPHFDMEIFARKAGVQLVHIPIKAGAAGMLNDLVSGDAQVAVLNVATSAAMVRAGDLRPFGVVSKQRLPEYPDVATMDELGFAGVGTLHWQSMIAPAGTPKETLEILHKALVQALNAPTVQEAFKKQIIRAVPTESPADAQAWLKSEIETWRKIVSEVKIELTD